MNPGPASSIIKSLIGVESIIPVCCWARFFSCSTNAVVVSASRTVVVAVNGGGFDVSTFNDTYWESSAKFTLWIESLIVLGLMPYFFFVIFSAVFLSAFLGSSWTACDGLYIFLCMLQNFGDPTLKFFRKSAL